MTEPVPPIDVSSSATPMTLHALHASTDVGTSVDVVVETDPTDPAVEQIVTGGGFQIVGRRGRVLTLERRRTLADTVSHEMDVLVVGLNPSLHAADAGVGFVSPSNRFWKAAVASGLVSTPHDPVSALQTDRVGMTDLVKRATAKAAELRKSEFSDGLDRLDALVRRHEPGVVCVVGITGWRAATGEPAEIGLQERDLGGRPVYVMPNPSGLNAHTNHDDLVSHFTRVQTLARQRNRA